MMEEMNWLLTDEFVAFSAKIKDIHERKKSKKAELKAFYDKVQVDIKALDEEAKDAEDEFQKWKKGQEGTAKSDE
jgi:transcription antitermination factor NusG